MPGTTANLLGRLPSRRCRMLLVAVGLAGFALRAADQALPPAAVARVRQSLLVIQRSGKGADLGSSGFVVAHEGPQAYVVTSLPDAGTDGLSAFVRREDGTADLFPASLVAYWPVAHLALLAVPGEGLPAPVPLATGQDLAALGQCTAAGFPLTTALAATQGTLPEVTFRRAFVMGRRLLPGGPRVSLLDLSSVRGDQGSVLLNDQGEVVGVTTTTALAAKASCGIAWNDVVKNLLTGTADLHCQRAQRLADGWVASATATRVDPLHLVGRIELAVAVCTHRGQTVLDLFRDPATRIVQVADRTETSVATTPLTFELPIPLADESSPFALVWIQERCTLLADGSQQLGQPTLWRFACERPSGETAPEPPATPPSLPAPLAEAPPKQEPGPQEVSRDSTGGATIRRVAIDGKVAGIHFSLGTLIFPTSTLAVAPDRLYWLDRSAIRFRAYALESLAPLASAPSGSASLLALCQRGLITTETDRVHLWDGSDFRHAGSASVGSCRRIYGSPQARHVPVWAAVGRENRLLVWDTDTGTVSATYPVADPAPPAQEWASTEATSVRLGTRYLATADLSPDGTAFAGVDEGRLRIFGVGGKGLTPVATGAIFSSYAQGVGAVIYSGDGSHLIAYESQDRRGPRSGTPAGYSYVFAVGSPDKPLARLVTGTYGQVVDAQEGDRIYLLKDSTLSCYRTDGTKRGELSLPGRTLPCAFRSAKPGQVILYSQRDTQHRELLFIDWLPEGR